MPTFLLIHGAAHDGWCWGPVAKLLRREGHRVVAPDLPCDDPVSGMAEYVQVAVEAVGLGDDDVVVVGHSLGALTAAVASLHLNARGLVFVAGIIGQPRKSLEDLVDVDADRDMPLDEGDFESDDLGRFKFTEAGARRALYHDCSAEVIAEACAHLRFQKSLWTERLPIDAWPNVPIASIVCVEDRIVRPDWSRRVSQERLGVEPVELPGGHCPMLSRPVDLARVLLSS